MILVIGVTMGHDPNLFVDHKEGDWVKAQQKLGKINVRKINSSFRFIDDLLSLNDDSTFEKHYLSNRIRTEEKKKTILVTLFLILTFTLKMENTILNYLTNEITWLQHCKDVVLLLQCL